MTAVASFAIGIGVAIAGLWTVLLVTRQVQEITAGRRDIYFHVAAELVTAALLIAAGVLLLLGPRGIATGLAAFSLGALLYTTLNSPGYYAERRQWAAVAAFLVLAALTVVAGVALLG